MWRHIDQILYLNLDHEEDRKKGFLEEADRVQLPRDKLQRISAVHNLLNGYAGNCLSQIAALNLAIEKGYDNVLICEDDIVFVPDLSDVSILVDAFFSSFKNKWDVLIFGGARNQEEKTSLPFITKASIVFHTDCYLVHANYFKKLRDFFVWVYENFLSKLVLSKLQGEGLGPNPDVTWCKLQQVDNWFCLNPYVVRQKYVKSTILSNTVGFNHLHEERRKIMRSDFITLTELHTLFDKSEFAKKG